MIGYEMKMDLQEEIKEGPSIWKKCKDHQDHDDEDDYFAKSLLLVRKARSSSNMMVFRSQGSTQNTANTVSAGTSEDNSPKHCQEGGWIGKSVSDFTFDERDDHDTDLEVDQRWKKLSAVQEISCNEEETEENDFTLDAPATRSSSV